MTLYSVAFARSARRELERLPRHTIQRVIRAINDLQKNPRPRGVKKLVGSESTFRIRVGQYRVIYELDDYDRLVLVTRVRHRKEAYE